MTAITRLLFKKDLRALRPWLCLGWPAWLPFLLFPATISSDGEDTVRWYDLLQAPGVVLTILAVARLVQMDPPTGGTGYLGSRPVTRLQLLAVKATLAGLFLGLPAAVVRTMVFLMLSHHLSPGGIFAVLVDQTVVAAALVAAPFLLAMWTPRLPALLLVLIGGWVAQDAVAYVLTLVDVQDFHLPTDGVSLAIFVVGAAMGALLQVRYRRPWPVVAVLTAALALALWLSQGRADALAAHEAVGIKPVAAPGVTLVLDDRQPFSQTTVIDSNYWSGNGALDQIGLGLRIEGLPANEHLAIETHHTVVRTRGGRLIEDSSPSGNHDQYDWGMDGAGLADAFRQIMQPGTPAKPGGRQALNVLSLPADQSKLRFDPADRVEGTLEWNLFRYRVVAHLPLQPGARAIIGNKELCVDGVTIQSDQRSSKSDHVGLVFGGVSPAGTGGEPDPGLNRLQLVIVQDGQILISGNWVTTDPAFGDYDYIGRTMSFFNPRWGEKPQPPLPPTVAPGLYVMVADLVGRVTLPFSADVPPDR
jgi:hypothetical protein